MRFVLLSCLVMVGGCGGSDGVLLDGGGDGTTPADATTDAPANPDGSVQPDATVADAASDAVADAANPSDGGAGEGGIANGLPTDPGKIACGGSSCTASNQICCVTAGADGGGVDTCTGGNCNGAMLECDEAADCPAQQVCCYERNGNVIFASSCRADCTGGGGTRTQACRTQSECLSGTCAVHACTSGTIPSVETCAPVGNVCP